MADVEEELRDTLQARARDIPSSPRFNVPSRPAVSRLSAPARLAAPSLVAAALVAVVTTIVVAGPSGRNPTASHGQSVDVLTSTYMLGDEALIHGKLTYDRADRCFVLETPLESAGVHRAALIWPPGTTARVTDTGASVDVPGYGPILAGKWITAGGGSFGPGDIPDLPTAPAGCFTGTTEYVGVSDIETVTDTQQHS